MNSRKLMTFSLAVAAVLLIGQSAANAQQQGYQFGVGWGYSNFGYSPYLRNKEVPYFALHPPVYYSEQIVRRPYGVSPFAAPPGIVPAEMILAPQPIVIENPHYNKPEGAEDLPLIPQAGKNKPQPKKPQPKKPQPKKDNKNKDEVKATTSAPNRWNFVIKNPFFLEPTPPALVIK